MNMKKTKADSFSENLRRRSRMIKDILRSRSPNPPPPDAAGSSQAESSKGPRFKWMASNSAKASQATLVGNVGFVPSIQSVIDIVMRCASNVPLGVSNKEDYRQIYSDIIKTIGVLESHASKLAGDQLSDGLSATIKDLERQACHIENKRSKNMATTYMNAEDDAEDIIHCYREVEVLLRQLQTDIVLNIWTVTKENSALAKEQLNVETKKRMAEALRSVTAALYNSSDMTNLRTECTMKTREDILQELQKWARNPEAAKVYWMNGMAGTGKTTIAYSLCKRLESSHQLAASFFCSRSRPDCRNVARIVPTVAYQLSRICLPYRRELIVALELDQGNAALELSAQFQRLLYGPLMKVKDLLPAGLLVVVIDALDECEDRRDAMRVLNTLMRFAQELPIKFFVTCRPDSDLLNRMSSAGSRGGSLYHLHDVEQSLVQADIETYLESKLGPIGVTTTQLKVLAQRAGNLFIYASTIVQYVAPDDSWCDRKERLDEIVAMDSSSGTNAYKQLDGLYTAILSAALDRWDEGSKEKTRIQQVLQAVIYTSEPLSLIALADILRFRDDAQVKSAIEPLRAVLNVDDASGLVSALHASFPDYMLTASRSGKFYYNPEDCNRALAVGCFGAMERLLKFNICGFESSYTLDADVPEISTRIQAAVPLQLKYTCQYWSDHMRRSGHMGEEDETLCMALGRFLRSQVLLWIEVTNLLKTNQESIRALFDARTWIQDAAIDTDLVALYQDATRLLTVVSGSLARMSTPHIYVSVMALWDKESNLWKWYEPRMRGLVKARGPGIDARRPKALVTWKADHETSSMAVSPSGRVLVTGTFSGRICMWEAHTGRRISGPFNEHAKRVTTLAFAPDGASFASGSWDATICIWDAHTAQPASNRMSGHTNWVTSISYAPDGQHIASGSHDRTIRIWNVSAGSQVTCITGHTHSVLSVAYSPDGGHLVSGSEDHTICIWDVCTGNRVLRPLSGHTGSVRSVAYSPDGCHIASGSNDKTIGIWDASTGLLLATQFEGHVGSIYSVSYSPDGSRILSGSNDGTVRVWDVHTGQTVSGPFRARPALFPDPSPPAFVLDATQVLFVSFDDRVYIWDVQARVADVGMPDAEISPVCSLAFSPDSQLIVSGSGDGTVSIWDVVTGTSVLGPLIGHTQGVQSVAYSPCGSRVASASEDGTVRIWDALSGSLIGKPYTGHENAAVGVVFSPDGSRVASCSWDETIHVWNVESRDLVAQPFQGHTGWVRSVSFSPDGRSLASISDDQTIRIWNVESGTLAGGPFQGGRWAITFSPDGSRLAFDFKDNALVVCDMATGRILTGPCKGHSGFVNSICFSPNSHYVVSGSHDRSVRMWDAHTGNQVACLSFAHLEQIWSVAFSSDGQYIASSSEDGSIRVWDAHALVSTTMDRPSWEGLDEDGWVVRRDDTRLFWVPDDLRAGLKYPRNVSVIRPHGEWELDFTDAYMGKEWAKCYVSEYR